MSDNLPMPVFDIGHYDHGGYHGLNLRACQTGTVRVVPPGGERYAYDRIGWARHIEVSVSPTGRSVRVWVDGVEIPKAKPR